MSFVIKEYVSDNGKNYFRHWLESLTKQTRAQIQARLFRVETGNLGDSKSVGDGVFELRMHASPGFRLYFGKIENTVILLLVGGNKSSQKRDIVQAKNLWAESRRSMSHG